MVTRADYNQIAVNAAYSVLIELVRVLGEYRENIVLIGGWVPQILFQNKGELHTGSIDAKYIRQSDFRCLSRLGTHAMRSNSATDYPLGAN